MTDLETCLWLFGLIAALICGQSSPPPERLVSGVILVSSEAAAVKKVSDAFTMSMPYHRFIEGLSPKRYLVKEWGKRSAIVFDLESDIVAKRETECHLAESLSRSVGSDLTLKLGELSSEDQTTLLTLTGHSPVFPSGFDPVSAAVGVGAVVRFSIQDANGGASKSFDLGVYNAVGKERDKGLIQHPLRFVQPVDLEEAKASG